MAVSRAPSTHQRNVGTPGASASSSSTRCRGRAHLAAAALVSLVQVVRVGHRGHRVLLLARTRLEGPRAHGCWSIERLLLLLSAHRLLLVVAHRPCARAATAAAGRGHGPAPRARRCTRTQRPAPHPHATCTVAWRHPRPRGLLRWHTAAASGALVVDEVVGRRGGRGGGRRRSRTRSTRSCGTRHRASVATTAHSQQLLRLIGRVQQLSAGLVLGRGRRGRRRPEHRPHDADACRHTYTMRQTIWRLRTS